MITQSRIVALLLGILSSFAFWYQGVLIANDEKGDFTFRQKTTETQRISIIFFILAAILYWFKLVTVFGAENTNKN